jgi:flavodoxin
MAKIKIVYGSCGGNTEITCQEVQRNLQELGHEVILLKSKITKPADILDSDLLILASPTYGHGLLENFMDRFIATCNKEIQSLAGQKAVVIGLGNMIYDADYLLESAKILTEFLQKKEAVIIHEPLLLTKSPLPYIKKIIPNWVKELDSKLKLNA